ncbi:MAG: dipeptidase [Anaerolineaceae bacterium]|nr:dipeptidase [Anaerolineaceae bacterium]
MENPNNLMQKAFKLHEQTIVVDSHHDILKEILESRQKGLRGRINQYWAPKLRHGGVNVQVFPIYVDSEFLPELATRKTLQMAEAFNADLEDDNSHVVKVTSYKEAIKAVNNGKIAGFLAIEGAEGLGTDIDLFHTFYRLGVRMIGLTWNHRNQFADGTGEQATGGGLTKLGFAAIKEMDRLNILIDASHINETCFYQILETSSNPIVASHSNSRGIYDHPRNLSDDQIKALAQNDGVMGLLIHPGIIDPKNPTISRVVDHIAYVADLVGIEHIGIGTDFLEDALAIPIDEIMAKQAMIDIEVLKNGIEGLNRIDELHNLTIELIKRGFSDADINKVLGENFLRVFEKVLI